MNLYDAIMKAADHIERNPKLFKFSMTNIPECGTPGCAVGWICAFAGMAAGPFSVLWPEKIGFTSREFYRAMGDLQDERDPVWYVDATVCARLMRLYASKYHAPKRNFAKEMTTRLKTQPVQLGFEVGELESLP